MKFWIGISPSGAIEFLSKCSGGIRASDKNITQNVGFVQFLNHGDVVLADQGFDIPDDLGISVSNLKYHHTPGARNN